jgi:hypothetical protein
MEDEEEMLQLMQPEWKIRNVYNRKTTEKMD